MPLRQALSAARVATALAAVAVAALAVPGTATASTKAPVLSLTSQNLHAAPAAVHPDAFTNCTVSTSGNIAITPGTSLGEGVNLCSGSYELAMQTDGNLVVYGPTGAALWYSGTANSATTVADMQTDGNFVVYSGSNALWNSRTGGNPGAYVCFQTDGNLVVYRSSGTGQYTCNGGYLWDSQS
ncbi:hypothetical protein [Kitasatospora kifunensis]|uniref:Bulb-type lectin domain-containing protein n=1 Tax=Kitasatospora kifunensis TaxID=58351 RepID=A0A7W7W077_KITKI|nr:hypothetical protein [Kitasatospora kifunensis]MBB4928484.1 hypothetical protein [Kitasatospora kifunensis]